MVPITTFNSIVLTTDLSADAASAYSMAASLSSTFGASLTLLTCIDTSPHLSEPGFGALEAPILNSPKSLVDEYAEIEHALQECITAHSLPPNTSYRIIQEASPVQHLIVNFISEHSPDLVIMSSHGRSGIARALLGSVTEYVLRHTKRPVLVIPAGSR